MAKKKKNNDFSSQRNILDFRPHIDFVEPDQIEEISVPREAPATIASVKSDTDDLINNYQVISDLANAAQVKIDNRSKDLVIKLDPQLDAHIVAAVQRHFNDPNKTTITYNDYKECLSHINSQANFSIVDQGEIEQSSQDPFRTDFGMFGNGSPRPELQDITQSVKPIDLKNFQLEQLEKLLELLGPGISAMATKIAIDEISKVF